MCLKCQWLQRELVLAFAMALVLECKPGQAEEHDEEEHFDAQILPLGDAMLGQTIILQELQITHTNHDLIASFYLYVSVL